MSFFSTDAKIHEFWKYIFISACVVAQEWLNVTSNYTALMGDLRIDLLEPGIAVQLYEVKNDNYTLMGTIPVNENDQNVTIHCGVITKGGHYILQLISNDTSEDDELVQVSDISQNNSERHRINKWLNISFYCIANL